MVKTFSRSIGLAIVGISAAISQRALADVQLITNGDFETGDFTGWVESDEAGGSGTFSISNPGVPSPISGFPTAPNALGGNFYAVSDQGGPGAHVLSQSFTVPANATSVTLSYQMFVNDQDAGPFVGPLDYTGNAVEFATVDVLTATADPFSTAAGDVVVNEYQGADSPIDSTDPYISYSQDLTGLVTPGQTYQLRFGEADNQSFFQQGVDNVSILATVPEPCTIGLAGIGAFGLLMRRRARVM
jgi:PEP-CTERM motif